MFTLDRVMTARGLEALATERHKLRIARATAFMRRRFTARVAHISDPALAVYARTQFAAMERGGLGAEQDQLTALAPAVLWGGNWWDDDMPLGMQLRAGHWDEIRSSRVLLSRALAGLDLWHGAMRRDLADRHRVAQLLHELYADPRGIAQRGRDAHPWCAQFAPAVWSLMDESTRAGHIAKAAKNAADHLPSFQDAILFACLGLVLGVDFDRNPLYPQFAEALSLPDEAGSQPDQRRIALGHALVDYWKQIEKEL